MESDNTNNCLCLKEQPGALAVDQVRIHYSIFVSPYIFLGLILLTGCAASRNVRLGPNNVETFNRTLDSMLHEPYTISVDSQQGAGLMTIRNLAFEYGVLEFDLQGENEADASFLGLAFNIQDDSTYELIYFRPFNFIAESPTKRSHSIQYVSAPSYHWHKLRKEFPGKYEAEYLNPPDPTSWFTIRISISPSTVEVYDKKSKKILLTVDRLALTTSKKVGFWTGTNSRGSFKNLNLIKVR